jgi:hypothetical protein
VVDAADRLGEQRRHRDHPDLAGERGRLGHGGVLVVVGADLVGDGQRRAQVAGEHAGLLGEAGVGGDDHHVRRRVGLDGVAQDRAGVQVVDRDAEEALDLGGVQVHGDHPVGAGRSIASAHTLARIDTRGSSLLSPLA